MQQPIPRPGRNETCALVILAAACCSPALALLIDDDAAKAIVFGLLALSFWFPAGQIVFLMIRNYRQGKPWEWPLIVGGPSVKLNHRRN